MQKKILACALIRRISKFFIGLTFLSFALDACGQIETSFLKGEWRLKDRKGQVNYPVLYFNEDSSAVFSSRGDTLYRFKYSIKNDDLVLKSPATQQITRWKILRLSKDDLILKNLFEHNEKQVYKRSEK